MRLVRIIVAIILSISLVIVFIFMLLGAGIFSFMVDIPGEKITQTVIQLGDQVQIKVPLYETRVIQYKDVPTCVEEKNDSFFQKVFLENGENVLYSKICDEGKCNISIDLDDLNDIPEYLYLYVENTKQQCEKRKYIVSGHITTSQYDATLEVTSTLKKLLDLNEDDEDYRLKVTKASIVHISKKIMGTRKLSLSYDYLIEKDALLVNSVKKADIIFDLVPDSK